MRRTVTPAVEAVWRRIDERTGDLVALAVELGCIPSPHGQESAVAVKVADWLAEVGIESWLQPITGTSANVVGRLSGTGGGRSLLLNAHLDTGPPPSADLPARLRRIQSAWSDGGLIYGAGVINDKGPLAATMIAVEAIRASAPALAGDLWVTGVAFETGAPSIGHSQGIHAPGEGFGAWWLVNRGVVADFALVAETSGFGVIDVECGAALLEVTACGREIYTPRLVRGGVPPKHPSAVVAVGSAIAEIEAWAAGYERDHTRDHGAGEIVPKAQVLSLAGRPAHASAVVDVRLLPGSRPQEPLQSLRDHLATAGLDVRVELRQWSRGHVTQGAEALLDAIAAAHDGVLGGRPPRPAAAEQSMWRDMNMFNQFGIPAVCYGPPRVYEPYSDSQDRALRIEDLVAAAKVYAATALSICGENRPRPATR